MLNTVTIALITWAIAVTIAIAIMVAVVVRRLRLIRARAKRLAAQRRPSDTECPPSLAADDINSIVDMRAHFSKTDKFSRSLEVEDYDDLPEIEEPRPNSGAAALADRLSNIILPEHGSSTF
jgi:hypothetical protein